VVPAEARGRARIEAREAFVVAGLDVARLCFDLVGDEEPVWDAKVADGDEVTAGEVLVLIEGPLRAILTAERTALNVLGRLCGVATLTRAFAGAVEGTACRVVDTRKTTPGLRVLEKYAVRVGGGSNHRFGLDDGILIKDNHIAASGGITTAVERARAGAPHGLRIEVEVEDLAGLDEAISAGADAVLLDNMSVDEVAQAVEAAGGRVLVEVSGGVTLDTVASYAAAGADLVSVGALTHSAPVVDLALEVEP
ncbi:MAG: carboxylating nicotinate-nucleotide diphosphorylase, partial [Actinomycetota bacterium]|nr:carboxylating nicotinate-nucleotide diphosphorylase [Actinomycetota bacterium]